MYHVVTQELPRDSSRSSRKEEQPATASSHSERKNDQRKPDDDSKDDEKKERVLHTRVPAVLEQELKRFADNLRVPVSNLVRTILEDALEVADHATENVEGRLKKAAGALEKERQKLRKMPARHAGGNQRPHGPHRSAARKKPRGAHLRLRHLFTERMIMSTTTNVSEATEVTGTIVDAPASKEEGIVETVLELGFAWAAYGLKIATTAVEQAARVLGITASQLDKLADDFAAKSGVSAKEVATK